MSEHGDETFEHNLKAKLEIIDAQIKIPEAPAIETIFERAEEETKKKNTINFPKYYRYVATAAAIVLICVAIPVLGKINTGKGFLNVNEVPPQSPEAMQASDNETAPVEEVPKGFTSAFETESAPVVDGKSTNSMANVGPEEGSESENTELYMALEDYFQGDYHTDDTDKQEQDTSITLKSFDEYLNKKRTIELTLEQDSVSVLLKTNALEPEIINAFWIEGTYVGSKHMENEPYYVITLKKAITPEDFENGDYIPMMGDLANGNRYVSESAISVPNKVSSGIIILTVKIDIGTGDYSIEAVLE